MPPSSETPSAAAAQRKVPCPQCGTLTVYSLDNPWRPFCSERCKSLDFGAWASESYRVQARPDAADIEAMEQDVEQRHAQKQGQRH